MLALAGSIQLVPDGTLILHLIIILVMVAVLNRTLFKPINKVLAEREAITKGRLSEARETAKRVQGKLDHYESKLREARSEGYQMMEHRRAQSLKDREQKVLQLKAEINGQLAAEKEALRRESEKVRGELEGQARELGVRIAGQVMGRPVSGH